MNENELDDLDESAKFTKIILPSEHISRKKFIQKQYLQKDQICNLIGDYKVEKTLGQGTFGKVKQGYHIFTGQKVAIKILEKDKIDDTNDIERVAREIHILKIVRHPHIIHLYEIIETPSRLFLIMEHCCNGELFNYITSKNRLKEEEACRLFQQLISGIEYLGQLGIAHRDIKPENLLLDEQKNLKIVDFGLSNTFKKNEKLVTACGSPCYAAPELIKGLDYVGQKADIWSSGVVLFCLVCGHLPFEDQNTQSLYQKILSADYQFTCYLSPEVQNLIQQILVPEPELRYGLKQIKQNAWMKIYKPPVPIDEGNLNNNEDIRVHKKLLKEMKSQREEICLEYTKFCIQQNVKNNLTSHYHLLVKKKTIFQESLSEFSQLDMLDAEADLQVAKSRRRKQQNNEIPIPGDRQVRAHHSIPAAPRHNIMNIEKTKNQGRYGYQLKKMNQPITNINVINQNPKIYQQFNGLNLDSSQAAQNPNEIQNVISEIVQQQSLGQTNVHAQRKNNAQIKVLSMNQTKKTKNGNNIKPQQVIKQQTVGTENKNAGKNEGISPNNLQHMNLNDYNVLEHQNKKSNNYKKSMYHTQMTQSTISNQKRNNTSVIGVTSKKHIAKKVVKGTNQVNRLNQSSNKAPRHSSQIGPVRVENLSVNRSLTYQQMGPIISDINNQQNKTKGSISQMSSLSRYDNKKQQQQQLINQATIQNNYKRQSLQAQYHSKFQTINNKDVGAPKTQNMRQSGGLLMNNQRNNVNQQTINNPKQNRMISQSQMGEQINETDTKKKSNFTTKSKLKKTFQEFQSDQFTNKQLNNVSLDQRQQILNQMLQNKDISNNLTTESQGLKVSKKHFRANSSANQYNSTQPFLSQTEANKTKIQNGQIDGQQTVVRGAQNTITDRHIQHDQQNITNSIIISNSQILFQDMGNGKIMPIQLNNALGTIQPASSQTNTRLQELDHFNQNTIQQNQSAMGEYPKFDNREALMKPSHGVQMLNAKSNRQQRRKNAQSSRFNTLILDYSDVGTGNLNGQKSITKMQEEYQLNRQKYQNQRNQCKGVSMSLGISKDDIIQKQAQIQYQKKIPVVNNNLNFHGQRNLNGQTQNKQSRKTTRANLSVMNKMTDNNITRTPGVKQNLIPVASKGAKIQRNFKMNTIVGDAGIKQDNQNLNKQVYSTQPMSHQLSIINKDQKNKKQTVDSDQLNNLDMKNQTQKNIQQNIQHINNKIYQMKIIGNKQGSANNIPRFKENSQLVNRKNIQSKSIDQENILIQQKKRINDQHQRQMVKDSFLGTDNLDFKNVAMNYADPGGIHQTLEPSKSMLNYKQSGHDRHGFNNSLNFGLNPSISNVVTTLQPNSSVKENIVRNMRMHKIQSKK